jgi:hypothetical protein
MERALFLLVVLSAILAVLQVYDRDPAAYLHHQSDNQGYYQWLPSVLIDHNVDTMYWCSRLPSGKYLSAFTFGVALLQLPFFLIGHAWAHVTGQPTDGFSAPYAYSIMMSAATYAGLGCVLAYRLAKRFCLGRYAMAAALVMFFGTNLLYYSAHEGNMSHVYSFFLIGWFAWCCIRLMGNGRVIHIVGAVLSFGLLVLVRQVNIVVIAFPVLLALRTPEGISRMLHSILKHRVAFSLSVAVAFLPYLGMMLYWRRITGSFVAFGYQTDGPAFYWGEMVPGLVLLGIRNGWLLYTPIMAPVLAWLAYSVLKGRRPALGVLLPVVLICIVYAAWWCWYLGTSFGHRGFIDLYALLAIPMAWMFRSLWRSGRPVRVVSVLLLIALLWLNLGMTERYTWHWSQDSWTWAQLEDQFSDIVAGRYKPVGPR